MIPCSTTSDPKEALNVLLRLVVKGRSVDPYGAQAKNLTCLLVVVGDQEELVCTHWMVVLRKEKEKETEGCP